MSQRQPFSTARHGVTALFRPISPVKVNELAAVSTCVIVFGLLLAALLADTADTVDIVFRHAALVVGGALMLALVIEAQVGVRNLVRVDFVMLSALYLLTFFEFLFPQESLARRISPEAARTAVEATLLGFGGIAVGRHLFPARWSPRRSSPPIDVTPGQMLALLLACFCLGYLKVFMSVNFNVFDVIYYMQQPRFSQPWGRGRLGNLSSLLNELGLLVYLIPPLAGAILAHGRRSSFSKFVAGIVLAFVLFDAFASGTRSVLLTHLATLAATFALLQKRLTLAGAAKIGVPAGLLAFVAVYYLPELRTVGLGNFAVAAARTDTLFVDMNLVNIAGLTEAFPRNAPYLGLEIPYTALIRPIPRAFWPGKPEGLSISIEEVLGAGAGWTLSAAVIGELWMAGGFGAIALGSVLFGAVASAWNRIGANATTRLEIALYASAFFAAGICMRSFMAVAPPLLPTIALWAYLKLRQTKD